MLVLAKMAEPHQLLTLLVMMIVGLMGRCQGNDQARACSNALADIGIDQKTLKNAVGHGIHSITVRDIRYYFEPTFPESNSVPTVNPIFDSRFPVLPFAPLGSEAATPGMRVLDEVMSHDDGTDNYLIQGLSRMEKIAHGMHMLEVWQETSQEYQKVRLNPPNGAVCSCITDDRANGLFDHLETISTVLKNWSNATALNQLYGVEGSSNDFRKVQKKFHDYHFGYNSNDFPGGLNKRSANQDDSGRRPGHLNYSYDRFEDSAPAGGSDPQKPGHLNYSYDKFVSKAREGGSDLQRPGHLNYGYAPFVSNESPRTPDLKKPGHLNYGYASFESNESPRTSDFGNWGPGHLNYRDYGLNGNEKKTARSQDFNLQYNRYNNYPFKYDNGASEEKTTEYDQEPNNHIARMEMEKMPTLQDQESWAKWKVMLEESKMKHDENRQLALYLFCKARN